MKKTENSKRGKFEKIEMEAALGKAQDPDSLAKRIATARKQMEEGIALGEDDLEMDDDEDDDDY
jgi:twitching motility protein PilT